MKNSQLAFVFPGQGSQYVGMLQGLSSKLPVIGQTFSQASEILGYDLWKLIVEGPAERLNLTEYAQTALLTASTALWRAWQAESTVVPAMLTGHSLGEWSALVAAEVVAFEEALELVRLRGRYMQEAVPAGEGAMAAILGLADAAVVAACQEASEAGEVAAVNFNSPGQLVIAGKVAAVEKAIVLSKAAGAKRAVLLPVSAPFHTRLMKPAAEKLAAHVETAQFNSPKIPIIHNVHVATENDPQKIKQLIVDQIYSPVPWVNCIKALVAAGVTTTLEMGPGKVLGGLNRRIDKNIQVLATEDEPSWLASLEFFNK